VIPRRARRPFAVVPLGLALAALAALAGRAHANSRFPNANQLVVAPDDPRHVVVRATYGTLVSHDGGRTFQLVCEQAIGTTGDADPMLGVFAGGTMVAGVVAGISSTSDDGCSWAKLPGFSPRQYVVDVTVQKDDPRSGVVVSSTDADAGGFDTVLFETSDGGKTFRRMGVALGKDVLAQTVEVARSDPRRVYVSGTVMRGGASQTPVILRSDDRGKTFVRTELSAFGVGTSAWISAVDPRAPGTLYVRLRTTDKDRLLVSTDGARTFQERFVAAGSLTGFALSPDGEEVALGGAADGVQLARTKDFVFARTSDVHAQCLTWTAAGLYACGVEWLDHFVVGLSTDRGKTFAALAHMAEACPMRCAPGSTVGQMCTGELWRATASTLGQGPGACEGDAGETGDTREAERSPPGSAPASGPPETTTRASFGLARVALAVALLALAAAAVRRAGRRRRRR
jgi:hypothetical protein